MKKIVTDVLSSAEGTKPGRRTPALSPERLSQVQSMTAVLHIGVMKTGSTSIQSFLENNVSELLERGVYLPRFATNPLRVGYNSSGLFTYSFDTKKVKFAKGVSHVMTDFKIKSAEEHIAFKASLRRSLEEELAAAPDSCNQILFSAEALSFCNVGQIEELRRLFDGIFSKFKVVVYIRRQDRFLESKYSTDLMTGSEASPIDDYAINSKKLSSLDYNRMINAWVSVFGRDAVHPRIFEREDLYQGDSVSDLMNLLGIADLSSFKAYEPTNSSLTGEAQELIRQLNVKKREAASPLPFLPGLKRTVRSHYSGKGQKLSRDVALAILEHCRESNEKVRASWFPEKSSLFPEDVGSNPTDSKVPEPIPVIDLILAMEADLAENPKQAMRRRAVGKNPLEKGMLQKRKGMQRKKRAARRKAEEVA